MYIASVDEGISEKEEPLPTDGSGNYLLEFGQSNELGRPVSICLKVINTTAIPTTLHSMVSTFPAANVPRPQQQGT